MCTDSLDIWILFSNPNSVIKVRARYIHLTVPDLTPGEFWFCILFSNHSTIFSSRSVTSAVFTMLRRTHPARLPSSEEASWVQNSPAPSANRRGWKWHRPSQNPAIWAKYCQRISANGPQKKSAMVSISGQASQWFSVHWDARIVEMLILVLRGNEGEHSDDKKESQVMRTLWLFRTECIMSHWPL